MSSTLVLGIGNTLLSDEGAGVHVINHLLERHADEPDVTYLDGGTLSFTLAGPIAEHTGLIVVDAARLDAPAGTVRLLEDAEIDRYLVTAGTSVHDVSLIDLFDIARLSRTLPQRRALVGIQPQILDWGDSPSPIVAAAIPEAAALVIQAIRRWRTLTD